MRRNTLVVALSLALLPLATWAQQSSGQAPLTTEEDVYCSGMVTTSHVPQGTAIVSGEESLYKVSFFGGDYVYINRGADKGVKAGDMFSVMRPVSQGAGLAWINAGAPWFGAQGSLLRGMGQMWEDEGRLKVVVVDAKTSIAQITNSCGFMQRGDVVEPFIEREVPQLRSELNFDRFAPPSGKQKARVVAGKGMDVASGTNDVVYVNLGSKHGVKVGDYLRFYRYQNNEDSLVFQTPDMGTELFGFGAAPDRYSWKNLPREVLGEGIVLRATPNSATVLITISLKEIYNGDYCELE